MRVNSLEVSPHLQGIADPQNPFPWKGVYFQTVPLELEALPEPGYQFVGWLLSEDGVAASMSEGDPVFYSSDPVIELSLSADTSVEAVFETIPLQQLPVVLHEWDFEDAEALLSPSFTLGGGTLGIVPGPTTEVLANTGGDFETQHLRVNNPLGAEVTFSLPTSGYEQISLDFLTRRSGQGAGVQTLAYTLDGSTWVELETYEVFNAVPQAKSFDFSAISGVSDNADFAVRITFARSQAQLDAGEGLGGNNRFDDVRLSGIALPTTNLPPVVNEANVPELEVAVAGDVLSFGVSEWFADPEEDSLSYSVTSSNLTVLGVSMVGEDLTVTTSVPGDAWVTVSASDGQNPAVEASFRVLVYPAPHVLDGQNYFFTEWSADEPAGAFPPHMIFLQSDQPDPDLSAPLLQAYSIAGDAAAGDDPAFPYAAGSRTRINGLGDEGISFINTGRAVGRDLGAALLALDTRGVSDIRLRFTAQTRLVNTRVYALRLQARPDHEAAWADVLIEGSPVEYLRSPVEGHTEFFDITLPAEYEDEANLQLQWRYYFISGLSGARPELRLDDVLITTSESPQVPTLLVMEGLPSGVGEGALPVITVRVLDADGFPVTDFSGEITLSVTGGVLTGTTTLQAVDGIAVFEGLSVSGIGSMTFSATATGLDPAEVPVRSLRMTDVMVPEFVQGEQDLFLENNNRIPVAFRFKIEGLAPNATYRYGNRMAHDATDTDLDDNGAGNVILIPNDGTDWVRSTSAPRFLSTDLNSRHAELTSDSEGVWEGWVVTEPSGNARFTPGNALRPLLMLNDGDGGEEPLWFLRASSTVTVLELGTASGQGTAVHGETANSSVRFVAVYEDSDTLLALTQVEARGSEFDDRYADFYFDTVAGHPGRWGSLIPNTLTSGVDRIAFLDMDGTVLETLDAGLEATLEASGGTGALWLPSSGAFIFLPGGNGRWDDPNHWAAPGWPNGAGVEVFIGAGFWGDREIELPESVSATVGTVTFANGAHRTRLVGPGNFIFAGDGEAARIVVSDADAGWAEVDFASPVTLATDLILDTQSVESDPLMPVFGSLRLRGGWIGPGGLIKTGPGVASLTGMGKDFTGELRVEEGVLRLTDPATPGQVSAARVLPDGQVRLVSTGETRVYDFGVPLQLSGSGRNPADVPEGDQRGILGALRFDPFANDNDAVLPGGIQLVGTDAVSLHVDGTRNVMEVGGSVTGTAPIAQSGGGMLRLSGTASGVLNLTVSNGQLRVDGAYPLLSVTLTSDGVMGGTGALADVSGAGTVSLGPDEELTVNQVSGLNYVFHLVPGEGTPRLRLKADPPFVGGLNASNSVKLYLDGPPMAHPRFGFFSESGADLAAVTQAVSWQVFDLDEGGSEVFKDTSYQLRGTVPSRFTALEVAGDVEGTILGMRLGPENYAAWAAVNYAEGGEDGPTDNPFGTAPNLLSYALGLPVGTLPDLADIQLGVDGQKRLFARFHRDPLVDDIAYIVEITDNLMDWEEATILYDSRETLTENNDINRMLIVDENAEGDIRFLRLRIFLETQP